MTMPPDGARPEGSQPARCLVPAPPTQPTPLSPAGVKSRTAAMIVPFGVGAAVAITLGVYGRLHDQTGIAFDIAGLTSIRTVKVWLATAAVTLAVTQIITAYSLHGLLPKPAWTAMLHRWSGRLAVACTLPVAAHCLYAFGFAYDTPRVLIHSLLGCLFYGAFTAKMLILNRGSTRPWLLPVMGGVVFTVLVGLWLTSSLWFFTSTGFQR
jgi:Family of unknown function (DUF6529)